MQNVVIDQLNNKLTARDHHAVKEKAVRDDVPNQQLQIPYTEHRGGPQQ